MSDKNYERMIDQIGRICTYANKPHLIWSYFDLVQMVFTETGLQESDGGDGKKFCLTLPKNIYNLMSFTIGPVRVLGIGHSTKLNSVGLSFICPETVIESLSEKKQAPPVWGEYKNKKIRGKKQYLTSYPSDLLTPCEIRTGWIKSVQEIASLQWKNHIKYLRHSSLIYRAAEDKELRAQIFKDAGLEI